MVGDDGVELVFGDVGVGCFDGVSCVLAEDGDGVVEVEGGCCGGGGVAEVFGCVPREGLGDGLVLVEDGFGECGEEGVHGSSVKRLIIRHFQRRRTHSVPVLLPGRLIRSASDA